MSTDSASTGKETGIQPALATLAPDGKTPNRTWVKWAVLAWMLAITAFHLGSAATGRSIHRDAHLGTALEYAKGTINLLKPVIVGFNLNGAPTPQEFPLWQATAALAFKALGTWFGWANLVSLLYLFSALYPLFKLAQRFAGEDCAWWTVLVFLAQPLIFLSAGQAGTDGQSLAAAVWFLFFAMKLYEEQNLTWLVLTALTGTLAAVSKLPFFMAAGLGCACMTLSSPKQFKKSWAWLAGAALFIGMCFMLWTKYTARCYAQAELPFVDLRPSNPDIIFWFFGDLKYRLSPGIWITGLFRVLTDLFGGFGMAGAMLLALALRGSSRLARWWLVGAVVTTLIFFHVVLHHHHYYLMFAPAVAILCSQVAARFETEFLAPAGKWLARLVCLTALALSTVQGLIGGHVVLHLDQYPDAMAEVIRKHTTRDDKLLIQGGGWGGELLLLSDRNGLSIWNTSLLEDRQTYARLKEMGFTKLVMVSESPLLTAIQRSTKVGRGMQRESYQKAATPIVRSLPAIIQDDDILIKELP